MNARHRSGAVRVTRLEDTPPQRWRNGGGWTRELLALPDTDDWQVRVSVADIESDGSFSSFPGVRRFFSVLQGAGVELNIDGRTVRVTRDDAALQFAGEAKTSCRMLDGPTRDLNLMVRGTTGALERVVADVAWEPRAQSCGLFAMAEGRCRADDASMPVSAFSLLWFERVPGSLSFDSAGWWLAA
ncbi:MAG TPA: HutD family protein [Burkholderiaceae bacterium]|nr:HutD family protein [Burkholderiaceae bacterium]